MMIKLPVWNQLGVWKHVFIMYFEEGSASKNIKVSTAIYEKYLRIEI